MIVAKTTVLHKSYVSLLRNMRLSYSPCPLVNVNVNIEFI